MTVIGWVTLLVVAALAAAGALWHITIDEIRATIRKRTCFEM